MKLLSSSLRSLNRCCQNFGSLFNFFWSLFCSNVIIDCNNKTHSYVAANIFSPIHCMLNLSGVLESLSTRACVKGLLTGGFIAKSCSWRISLVSRLRAVFNCFCSVNAFLSVCLGGGVARSHHRLLLSRLCRSRF